MNFTSAYPSANEVSCLTHHGYVPLPDCLRTFGLLRAVASASHPIHEIHFSANLGPSYVTASSKEVHKLAQEFLGVTAPAPPAPGLPTSKHGKHRSKRVAL